MDNNRHTILLLQASPSLASRTYYDFEHISEAIDAVIRMFEQRLIQQQPSSANISYDVSELMRFIDGLQDLACLIFEPRSASYVPRNKQWVKQQVTRVLERQASGNAGAAPMF